MKDKVRETLKKDFNEFCENLIVIATEKDFLGIETALAQTAFSIIKSNTIILFSLADEMSIDKAAQRYGFTIQTLYKYIKQLNLQMPQPIQNKTRVMIPKSTIIALDQYFKKKPSP